MHKGMLSNSGSSCTYSSVLAQTTCRALPAGRTGLLLVTEFQTIENSLSHFLLVLEEHLKTR